jgi:hypothetical protein
MHSIDAALRKSFFDMIILRNPNHRRYKLNFLLGFFGFAVFKYECFPLDNSGDLVAFLS